MFIKGILFLGGVSSLWLVADLRSAWITLLVSTVAALLVWAAGRIHKPAKASWHLLFPLAGIIWACTSAIFWLGHSSQLNTTPQRLWVEGAICGIPVHTKHAIEFDFCVEKFKQSPPGIAKRTKFKLRWSHYLDAPLPELAAGQRWQLFARLLPNHARQNPGGFDLERWLLSEGYAGTGQVKQARFLGPSSGLIPAISRFRQSVYRQMSQLLAESEQKPFLLALVLGERGELELEHWQAMQLSGTSHLMAISGLHIGVAALWSYWLFSLLWKQSCRLCLLLPAQTAAELASLAGALLMLTLSGFGLPAQRAFIMIVVLIISRWSGCYLRLTSVLAIALVIILLLYPFSVLSASFWLSFGAVLVISLVLERKVQVPDPGVWQKLHSWLLVNWFLFLAMLPLSLAFFDMVSWVALVANLILIPLTSFVLIPVLYLALLAMACSEVLAGFLMVMASQISAFSFWLQQVFAEWNQLVSSQVYLGGHMIFLLGLVVLLLLSPRKLLTSYLLTTPILLLCLGFSVPLQLSRSNQAFNMVVFDIGQGLGIYIETPSANLLFDTGWGAEDFAMADSVILPYFKARGVRRLNALVVSHNDSDHAGGLDQLRQSLPIDQILTGEPGLIEQARSCHQTQAWQDGPVSFEFLPHLVVNGRQASGKDNNWSCVLQISSLQNDNPWRILLTGDIEAIAEQALIARGLGRQTLVVAPHHGSKTSSSEKFVVTTQPEQVIFSAGYANQWGFPKPAVVERYRKHQANTWTTWADGAILVWQSNNHEPLQISSQRQLDRHFWLANQSVWRQNASF